MSTSSTSSSSGLTAPYNILQSSETADLRFDYFVHDLLQDLRQEDALDRPLFIENIFKGRQVKFSKGEKNPVQISLAILKVYNVVKKNLGNLINLNEKEIAFTTKSECVELLKKCEAIASSLKLEDVCKNLHQLLEKIAKVTGWIESKTPFYMYRHIGKERRLLACMVSRKSPEAIQNSPEFWRRCLKAVSVEFCGVFNSARGAMPQELFSDRLSRRIALVSITSKTEGRGRLFELKAGLCFNEALYRFITLHSKALASLQFMEASRMSQEEFLQIVEYLLAPGKHPISWLSATTLWKSAELLGVVKVKTDCMLWLKNEMQSYRGSDQNLKGKIFSQVLQWHQGMLERYPRELQTFYAEVIELAEGRAEFDQILDQLMKPGAGLSELIFSYSDLSLSQYKRLSALPTLRQLSLISCKIDDTIIESLTRLKLEELHLDKAEGVTEMGFWHLGRINTLRHVTLKRFPADLTDTGLHHLSRLPLSSMNLKGCWLITDYGLKALKEHVKELIIDGSPKVTSGILKSLASIGLEKLRLSRIVTFTTEDLLLLTHFSNLRHLELVGTLPSTTADLAIPALAAASPRLTHLKLKNLGLTNLSMGFIYRLPLLEALTLSNLPISSLGSVPQLSYLTHLGLLDCKETTARSLKPMRAMSSLSSLRLASDLKEAFNLADILALTQLTTLRLEGEAFGHLTSIDSFPTETNRLSFVSVHTFKVFDFFLRTNRRTESYQSKRHPTFPSENLSTVTNRFWSLISSSKERIRLDYFKLLLEQNSQQWLPKIKQELANRVGKRNRFLAQDFPQALELMSWAIDSRDLDLTKMLWQLFFDPRLHNYAPLARGPHFTHSLDNRLLCSVYKHSYADFLDREPAPCPLEVIQFLKQKRAAKTSNQEAGTFLGQCLQEYTILFVADTASKDIEELRKTNIAASHEAIEDLIPSGLSISDFLGRTTARKLLGRGVTREIDGLCKKFRGVYSRFSPDKPISLGKVREIADLIVFAKKYQLKELEKIFTVWLASSLATQTHLMDDKGLNGVLKILKKAELFQLIIHTEELPATLSRENLDWWLDKLSQAVPLVVVFKDFPFSDDQDLLF